MVTGNPLRQEAGSWRPACRQAGRQLPPLDPGKFSDEASAISAKKHGRDSSTNFFATNFAALCGERSPPLSSKTKGRNSLALEPFQKTLVLTGQAFRMMVS